MKKITRQLAVIAMSVILAVILCFSFACAPQDNDGDNTLKKQSEIAGFNLPHSAGQASDEFYDYNSKLFYRRRPRSALRVHRGRRGFVHQAAAQLAVQRRKRRLAVAEYEIAGFVRRTVRHSRKLARAVRRLVLYDIYRRYRQL